MAQMNFRDDDEFAQSSHIRSTSHPALALSKGPPDLITRKDLYNMQIQSTMQSRGYQSDESTLASEDTDRSSHEEGVVK